MALSSLAKRYILQSLRTGIDDVIERLNGALRLNQDDQHQFLAEVQAVLDRCLDEFEDAPERTGR